MVASTGEENPVITFAWSKDCQGNIVKRIIDDIYIVKQTVTRGWVVRMSLAADESLNRREWKRFAKANISSPVYNFSMHATTQISQSTRHRHDLHFLSSSYPFPQLSLGQWKCKLPQFFIANMNFFFFIVSAIFGDGNAQLFNSFLQFIQKKSSCNILHEWNERGGSHQLRSSQHFN